MLSSMPPPSYGAKLTALVQNFSESATLQQHMRRHTHESEHISSLRQSLTFSKSHMFAISRDVERRLQLLALSLSTSEFMLARNLSSAPFATSEGGVI